MSNNYDANCFDDLDPTPYDGGYNIEDTYGQPLPPSNETCYPVSSYSSGSKDGEGNRHGNDEGNDYGDKYVSGACSFL